jgi:hypothetical protein
MRVQDQGHAAGAERSAAARHVVGQLCRKLAVDVGPIHTRFFEQRTAFEDACHSAATAWTLPCVSSEFFGPIRGSELATDVGLK